MERTIITWTQLKKELKNADHNIAHCECNYDQYLEWRAISLREDPVYLNARGRVRETESTVSATTSMYSDYRVMALGYYPYSGSDLYECRTCKRLFFIYVEMGGHAVERRCQFVQEELLVFESPNYIANPDFKNGSSYDPNANYSNEQLMQIVTNIDGFYSRSTVKAARKELQKRGLYYRIKEEKAAELAVRDAKRAKERESDTSFERIKILIWIILIAFIVRIVGCLAGIGN